MKQADRRERNPRRGPKLGRNSKTINSRVRVDLPEKGRNRRSKTSCVNKKRSSAMSKVENQLQKLNRQEESELAREEEDTGGVKQNVRK